MPDCLVPGWLSLGNGRGEPLGQRTQHWIRARFEFGRQGGEALSLAWWLSGARLVPGWLSLGNGQQGGEPLGAHKVESALFKFALWQLLL